ncbi:hypothetical protein F5Y17DRAFT_171942 [Xylariaceae sp. FL0594]|nr:hypothetical protein F5Y17DRAFT_171942 [Xylariaceae sp. FL0594]
MPPSLLNAPLHSLIDRDTISSAASAIAPPVAQVVCAWPVSGQYGFGTRILYYILVVTCVLARRTEWLRNACLAAALLLPAVAAIHAVVLAAVHIDNAVDMDIYGAFQICSIGILAAPITVYNSKTYFNDPGRNIIFIWTGLLLTGMLSLTVEFFRIETKSCGFDDSGNPIDPFNAYVFPYNNADCNLTCTSNPGGPVSPIRQGAANEIYVIPAPQRLTFSVVTLLAAGSSIPPILTLLFTWEKILDINWKRTFGREDAEVNAPIEGTNGATPKMLSFVNSTIQNFLGIIQILIFGGIIFVLLVLGELNFWSPQVIFQTEPFSSIGQWANVVATALVVAGSLFYVQKEEEPTGKNDTGSAHSDEATGSELHCPTRGSHGDRGSSRSRSPGAQSPLFAAGSGASGAQAGGSREANNERRSDERNGSLELRKLSTAQTFYGAGPILDPHRNKIATRLHNISKYMFEPSEDRYSHTSFNDGKLIFPDIPGEAGRNARFQDVSERYRASREHGQAATTPAISRQNSFPSLAAEGDRPMSRGRSVPPSRSNTTPVQHREGSPSSELSRVATSPTMGRRRRRQTLEVPDSGLPTRPALVHMPSPPSVVISDGEGSPRIVISAEPEEITPNTPPARTLPP